MEQINEIYALYDAYIQKVDDLEKNRKITAGLFGLTKGPEDDPCHDKFAEDMEAALKEVAAAAPEPEEVSSLLEYIYTVPLRHKDNNMIYWMFTAVHTLALCLVQFLDRAQAQRLYERYSRDYPRWERLPAQKKTLKALKEAAEGAV